MGRIEEICSYIDSSVTFADIGCDHGYCTLHALKSGKCQTAIIADVSAKSLAKAEMLLASYIEQGRCRSVCCDGLQQIDCDCGQVLIAGMGGMEIIKILTEGFIPQKFIFQPMKNAKELRKFLISNGCKITSDDIFFDNNYYFIIKGERFGGTDSYSEEELVFGKDSLHNPVFKEFAQKEVEKLSAYNANCALDEKIKFIKKAANLQ